jgi:formimidoylglutamate deiminase
MPEARWWAPRAFLTGAQAHPHWHGEGWHDCVLLQVDAGGRFSEITPGVTAPPDDATVLPGPLLPSLVNAHSHAFQRAFAGLAERLPASSHSGSDDFWSWRDRMYGVALRITPAQLRAVAAQLYLELLRGGYTQVCEFHYLHHDPSGHAYDVPATLAFSLADAATDVGLGLTVLPVLYERAGFTLDHLRDDQRRFAASAPFVNQLRQDLRAANRPLLDAGLGIHSLRAASPASMTALVQALGDEAVPIHIHVAEQRREVEDCRAATGARPIEWLCRSFALDQRWQLIHATHATPAEIDAVAPTGAGVVFCPSTEANLGDGLPDLPLWLAGGVPLALGSDSQVGRSFPEELRWLEYGQRLTRHERNVVASRAQPATAARLLTACLGGRAAGQQRWGLTVGARADALVLDANAEGVRGVPPSHLLDALVFATNTAPFREVYVGGKAVIIGGQHARAAAIGQAFDDAMAALWESETHTLA